MNIDIDELERLASAVSGWSNCSQAWLDTSEDDTAAVVGHINEDGATYPVATIDCDQYYHGGDSLPLAKFYASANPAAVLELIGEVRRLRAELAASQARENALRDGLQIIAAHPANEPNRTNWDAIAWEQIGFAEHALTAPTDDTTLRQAIKVAKEEMRDRCADIARLEQSSASECGNWDAEDAARRIADDILALEVE